MNWRLIACALLALGVCWFGPASVALADGAPDGGPAVSKPAGPGGHNSTLGGEVQAEPGSPGWKGSDRSRIGYSVNGVTHGGGNGTGSGTGGVIVCGDTPLQMPTDWEETPALSIQSGPPTQGVVNVPTYFWITGSSAQPQGYFQRALTATYQVGTPGLDANGVAICRYGPPIPVTVWAFYWPVEYTFDWGDGTGTKTYLCGSPSRVGGCPIGFDASTEEIKHTYEISSLGQPDQDAFYVKVGLTLAIGMEINPTPQPDHVVYLRETQETIWTHYPVREVESLLTQ